MLDKDLHLAVSGAAFVVDYGIRRTVCRQRPSKAMLLAGSDVLIAGGLKEVYDALSGPLGIHHPYAGRPDLNDIAYDVYGLASGAGFSAIVDGVAATLRRHRR